MNGKILGGFIVATALIAGIAIYYLQVYHFYEVVEEEGQIIELTSLHSGAPEEIVAEEIEAIDAESSPIRYRACFQTPMSQALLTETYETYEAAEPLTAPGWFDCYNADEIGEALVSGQAIAFLSKRDVIYGVDRVAAVFDDGRGYIWHQISDCGAAAFEGDPLPEGCPEPAETPNDDPEEDAI
ncbi:histidine kinase [Alphaproteobacteria bacterium KMM 3653]|uniref:Histidine kinase n=1 Tax=Harenicola maris TaxID=2841044 RepID=A0AAP2G504_9RHOB|nr:histidine kinase [Harenicola maris]